MLENEIFIGNRVWIPGNDNYGTILSIDNVSELDGSLITCVLFVDKCEFMEKPMSITLYINNLRLLSKYEVYQELVSIDSQIT